jgi:sigma54-dependent transcription regulator
VEHHLTYLHKDSRKKVGGKLEQLARVWANWSKTQNLKFATIIGCGGRLIDLFKRLQLP